MRRPDQSGFAVDPMPQVCLVNNRETMTIQVWIDHARPESHRDPSLRDYLARMAEQYDMPAVIRWSTPGEQDGRQALFLLAPALTGDGEWREILSAMVPPAEMTKTIKRVRRPL